MAFNTSKRRSKFLTIHDDLLSEEWREIAYNFACNRGRPWGAYVTKSELLSGMNCTKELFGSNPEKAIALMASCSMCTAAPYILDDCIHGVAVWCLTSAANKAVDYHIDYAELYRCSIVSVVSYIKICHRYETNVIHPPLYAGTMQISPVEGGEMTGGDFCVNTDGLEHYKRFGYKGRVFLCVFQLRPGRLLAVA